MQDVSDAESDTRLGEESWVLMGGRDVGFGVFLRRASVENVELAMIGQLSRVPGVRREEGYMYPLLLFASVKRVEKHLSD